MADFSHSTQRIQPSTSLSLSKRISSNGNGLPAKTVYDDVFGGPPKFGVPTFSPQIDDYSEIFGGFNSSRVSSIPILDLPIVNENDVYSTDVPTSKFDYSEVFGGFNGWDFAVSYQDLLAEPKGGGESSSDDVWTSAERGSLSEGSSEDPASSENNQPFSNEETYQSHDGNNQFNVLYQRTNQISAGDGVNTVPNIAEVNSLPTFTCVVDESFHAEKAERDTLVTEGTKLCSVDSDFGGRLMEEKHLKETMIDQGTRDTVSQISETEILKHKKSLVKEVTSDKPISQQVSESSLKHKKSHSVEAMTDQQVCHKILESDLKLCPEEAMPARPVRRQVSESDLQNKNHTREAMLDQPVHQQNTEIELKHQRNHFKESLSEKPVSHCVTDSECHLNHQSNVMGSGIYRSKSFITVSEINLRTVPSHVPPPSRPPPKVSIKRTASDGSPSFFDVEVDASSSAAAAAMKDAMEKAQARLKSAKESMERKRDGYQNRKKMGLKDDINVKERSEEEAKSKAYKLKEKVQNTHLGEDTEIKGFALEERQKITSLVQPAPQSQVTGPHANACMKSLKQKNVEEFGSSLEYKERGGGTEEWKRQEQYFELIKADGMTALMEEPRLKEQGENKSSGKDLNMAQEVCFWVEDEIKFTVQMKEDRDNKEKESSQREGNEKKLKESNEQYDVIWKQIHQMAENENNPREVLECDKNEKRECEMEESEKRLQEAFEQEENEKRQKEAHEREENEKRLKEVEELEEIEKQKEEARDRERKDIEKLRKEVWEREENERRLNEACEKEEIENRLNEAREREENEKRLKEAHEKEEIEKRLNEAREREDSKRRLQEALEREEIEKRQNEAREREANERLKEILEREENDKRQKEARNREENEKRLKEASGRDEDNKGLQEALECEVQKRAYQECMRDEDNMKFSVAQEAIVCVEDYCNSEASKDSPESADSVKKLGVANEVSEQDEDVNISSTRKTSKEELGTENFELGQTSYDPEESGQMRETTTSAIEHKEKAREMKTAKQVFTEQVDVTILGAEHVDQSAPERENFQNRKNFASEAMTQDNEKNLEQPQTALQEKDERTTDPYQGASGQDENKNKHIRVEGKSDLVENAKKMGAAHCTNLVEQKGEKKTAGSTSQTERKEKILGETLQMDEREKNERVQREREREKERLRKLEEDREREREREKDRMAVERATREARERAFADARERAERAAVERATAEVRQRAMAEAREKLEKASAEAREKSIAEKASHEARLRAERAAVERATAEARERAAEKARADKPPLGTRERAERTYSEKFSTTSRDIGMRRCSSFSDLPDSQVQSSDSQIESAQRCKARLERHQRTVERAAKALEEKNMRDLLAQREQSERNRLADTLDAEVKRWSSGKEGNLRALLSTLQYILGPDSGWQPIPLTEVITAVAVKKAYRKATLSVHPDKLQQRGATIQQKYICEKVFDLLKEAWNKFNSEER